MTIEKHVFIKCSTKGIFNYLETEIHSVNKILTIRKHKGVNIIKPQRNKKIKLWSLSFYKRFVRKKQKKLLSSHSESH